MAYTTTPSGNITKMKREAKIEKLTDLDKFYDSIAGLDGVSRDKAEFIVKRAFYLLAEMSSPQATQLMILKLMSDSYND